jgi:outer membrane receptor protein involved in Fe transport
MFTNSKLAKSVKLACAFGLASSAIIAPNAVFAQESESEAVVEKIQVTGSRIARTDLVATSPVNVFDEENLEVSGFNDLASFLNELPSMGVPGAVDTNTNFSLFSAGVNTVNLRNLGSNRTLVLVNGRRHIGANARTQSVDTGMIPYNMVERVEVVTGGASAVYGSEAMAGVINFILKDDYEGAEVNARYGDSTEGGGAERDINFTIGSAFAEDKGHALVYGGYSKTDAIRATDRDISAADVVNSSFGAKGSFEVPGLGFITQDDTTGLWDKPFVNAEDGFNRNARRMVRIPTDRVQFNANLSYQVNEHVRVFSESAYADVSSSTSLEPTIMGQFISVGNIPNVTVPLSNAFFPTELRDSIIAANAGNADFDPDNYDVTFRRRSAEVQNRSLDAQRRTFRTVIGVDGYINDYWNYEAYFQWGSVSRDQVNSGVIQTLNFINALDTETLADGTIQCADPLFRSLGCVPVNIFGEGAMTGEALDFVTVNPQTTSRSEQQVFGISFDGILFELPAGDVGVAFGYEQRMERAQFNSDALAQSGLTTGNTVPNVKGDYDVSEYFIETRIPLLADLPLAEYLGLEFAYRMSDYSTIGTADAYTVALDWQPIEDLKVRSSYSTAVRAPWIIELFDPGTETFRSFVDPCALGGAGGPSASGQPNDVYTEQSSTVQTNCATIPGTATLDPFAQNIRSAGGIAAGNPDLKEEEGETFAIGFVYSPSQIENLNFTIDYWDIQIDDAINSFTAQTTVDQCVRQASFPNNPFCSLIQRDPNTGLVLRINAQDINVASASTSGVDFSADYTLDIGPGQLNTRLVGTYVKEDEFTPFDGGEVVDSLGEIGSPEWKANLNLTYTWEDLTVAWSTRFIDGVNIENDQLDFGSIGSYAYHDLQARYALADGQYEVFIGVDNLFDKEPPILGQGIPGDVTGTNTAADVYDAIRTYWYIGIEASF